ncbi:haloacid dehalogenase type II [Chelatococcus reniformis]|uniref:(S)-2-haloacid dehalogenase n=1 Tax=Chelatococcus reniformis TaxID=1494448 RepID=A0A916XAB7_9HYPH|nr:haloacid dehalogenase type II [Chelatococcus reniformis]GGC59279.1 haloacid dehalogenase [Chelatococcus reniformis]
MIKAFVFDAYGTLYDVQSVAGAIDAAFPGHGDYITQVWRLKQLEYSWLRSMMGRYEDFWTVTRHSLSYTLGTLGLAANEDLLAVVADAYNTLSPYADAEAALAALAGYRRAILSNGSPAMLAALVSQSRLQPHLDAVLSVDGKRAFKPDPRAYEVVQEQLGVLPDEVVFVSSNGFDVCGAKSFGFHVARIERVTPTALRQALTGSGTVGPAALFKALRSQAETCGEAADVVIGSLAELSAVPGRWADSP